ncbi:MAG: LysM peptidoglycan-binding domain-containing protein, partial [Paludibacteraceae bacterium]|nr:LysM peptidoglycan-binding domain-containing protein [Paludibacteraceae bacterium]
TFDTAIEDLCIAWKYRVRTREVCDSSLITNGLTSSHDTVRMRRLSMLPTVIDMTYNDVVAKYITMYMARSKQISYMLSLSQHYFPLFETVFEQYELPAELKYLSIVESALNPRATSRMGAAGLWQFMPTTGKFYGLDNNSLCDERRDPIKSTYAAAQHFKDLYAIFEDWTLVLAAYNCGMGNVNKAIRRAGGSKDYWKIYPYLPAETRNYVPAFIAINYMMNYADRYNICPAIIDMPMVTDTILIHKRLHLSQVSDVLTIPIEELRQLNPMYKRDIIPLTETPNVLRLPDNFVYLFIEKQDSIYAHKQDISNKSAQVQRIQQNSVSTHKVKSGESLSIIAKRYRVTVQQLMSWNKLANHNLRLGQNLRVCPPVVSKTQYIIKKGDSLWSISRITGVPIDKIKQANKTQNLHVIQPGMRLSIPKN